MRQLNLIDSLLDFAKIEAGKMEILVEPVIIDEGDSRRGRHGRTYVGQGLRESDP